MKNIYVILIGLVMFNFMLIFTQALGVFPGEIYSGTELSSVNNQSLSNMSAMDLLTVTLGGLNFTAIATATGVFAIVVLAAVFTRSPVPLGIGGFASVFTWVWMQTYGTLSQFPIPAYLLAAGTIGIGLLFIINVIEMATGGHNG